MNKIFLTIIFLFYVHMNVYSQNDDDETQVLMDKISDISGMGGLFLGFSSVDNDFNVGVGGQGAVIINESFFIGGYGIGRNDDAIRAFVNEETLNLKLNHGGFWLGYIHKPKQMLHFSIGTKTGWGSINLESQSGERIMYDQIFVVTPEVNLEANVTLWFKINAGAGYRFTTGLENDFYDSSDLNRPTFHLAFLVGWFK